jgi:hypothetical protein
MLAPSPPKRTVILLRRGQHRGQHQQLRAIDQQRFGREAPAYAGTDLIIAREGRISVLYLFLPSHKAPRRPAVIAVIAALRLNVDTSFFAPPNLCLAALAT